MANKGASVLDLPGDLAPDRQTCSTPESREGQRDGSKTGTTRVPMITPGGQMETSPRGKNIHCIADRSSQVLGGLDTDLSVVQTGEGVTGSANYGIVRLSVSGEGETLQV